MKTLLNKGINTKNKFSSNILPEAKFYPLVNDCMFNSMFNNPKRKKYLCYFLSTFLNIDYDDLYNNIVFENNILEKDVPKESRRTVDCLCKYKNLFILIEMNNQSRVDVLKRNIDYMNKIYSSSRRVGSSYEYENIILINFNNFSFNEEVENNDSYMYASRHENLLDDIKIYQISLPKIREKMYNNTKLTKCEMFLLSCLLDEKEYEKIKGKGDDISMEYRKEAKRISKNEKFLMQNQLRQAEEFYWKVCESKVAQAAAKKAAIKESQKAKESIAKNMLNKRCDISLISEVTGLSNKQIASIKQ